jgi:hypothetical protein
MGFMIFFGVVVGLNALATVAVLRSGEHFTHKGLHVGMVWVVPVLGALMTLMRVNEHDRAERELARQQAAIDAPRGEPPSTDLALPGGRTLPLGDALRESHGFPVFDWQAVADALSVGVTDEAQHAPARWAAQRLWLDHLRHALGPHFHVEETEWALVLSSLEPSVARATAAYVATSRQRISRLLGELASFPAGSKSLLVVLDDEDWYYQYVSIYYPDEGEFAFSGGMFIDAGCPHFVVRRADLAQIEPVIAHELTHSALRHLELPKWLDEGIAVNTEHRVAGARPPLHTPQQIAAMQRRFWGEAEIQQFWSGASFDRIDDGNLLSYELARELVAQMAKTWTSFAAFVQHARLEDAGGAAALEHLGLDLGAMACALLGRPEDAQWSPLAASSAG